MRDTSGFKNRIYMAELEKKLERKRATIRKWEREGLLPKKLMPHRDEIGWRYWTPGQLDGLKQFRDRLENRQGFPSRAAEAS